MCAESKSLGGINFKAPRAIIVELVRTVNSSLGHSLNRAYLRTRRAPWNKIRHCPFDVSLAIGLMSSVKSRRSFTLQSCQEIPKYLYAGL